MNQEKLKQLRELEAQEKAEYDRLRDELKQGSTLELIEEIERLQAEVAAYHDYISGKITLGQLEAALNRIEPVYQQKPVEEWQGRREE